MSRDLRSIKLRWRAANALTAWRGIEPESRHRLLGDLEDMQREALSTGQDEEAATVGAAVAVLDVVAADGALATWEEATADIEWLIAELEAMQRRR